ncbi:hypothetical protein FRC02_005156 [Tulasnella sp. 418]|nr:hypothetical protein FRC02_005156 [Tulasnella sp. 418]
MVHHRVFFDFSIGEERAGRVVFELFSDKVPKTCENFRSLATGEKGLSQLSGVPLHYKNSIIHRSIANFMVQGGDFTKRNGKGGESIYGAPFEDEDLSADLDAEGLLCMANKGPNTNGSQWFVTLKPCPHLNGKHVVFGKVVHGFDVIVKISELPVDEKDRPLTPVVIYHSGELELRKAPQKPSAPPKVSARSQSVSSNDDAPSKRKRRHSDAKSPSDSEDENKDRPRRSHKEDDDQSNASEGGKKRSKKHSSKRKDKDRHRKKHRSRSRDQRPEPTTTKDQKEPREETEEELDLRLEREEKERIREAKLRELEELRKRPPGTSASGINYKGRGRMKYRDPETSLRGW